jgi:predicted transcriptional regulator
MTTGSVFSALTCAPTQGVLREDLTSDETARRSCRAFLPVSPAVKKLCRISYNDGIRRTTITLPPDLLERLRHIAAERKVSMAAVVREALKEKVSQHRVRQICDRYADVDIGFVDAAVLAVVERLNEPKLAIQ